MPAVSRAQAKAMYAAAAGIMFVTPDNEILLLHRGDGGDFPRTWGLPGGHQIEGETLEECARREAFEETGFQYDGEIRRLYDDGQFCNYIAKVEKFPVTLCDESTGYSWAKPDEMPTPLHPGMNNALRVAAIKTETDVAILMRDGVLPSPYIFANICFADIRITGTGMAFRSKIGEHVYRDPSLYLNDEFLQRCNGLPVILDHPDDSILNSEEFGNRVSGTCVMPYIKGDEVWSIARIYAQDAIEELIAGEVSTSPSVVFNGESGNVTVILENGDPLLIEGKPPLLDHIALVSKKKGALGVWDKGGPSAGVNLGNEDLVMADDENKVKNDAEKIDKVLSCMDSMMERMDAMAKRMDAMEKPVEVAADKKKADAEEEAKKKADAEAEEKKKADAEEAETKKADDAGKYADAQAKADRVYAAFGDAAPRPLAGESLSAYRARLVSKFKSHSPVYADVDVRAINDAALLTAVESGIYADAMAAARNPADVGDGQLIEIKETDRSGRQISTFRGKPDAWMGMFKSQRRTVAGINKGAM